jgi:uroporphyrinogen-III synthase
VTAGPVVLTVSPGAFPGLAEELHRLHIPVEELPLLTFAPPLDWDPVDAALGHLSRYDAIAFTSPRAAAAFIARYHEVGREAGRQGETLPAVWSGGPGTAGVLAPLLVPVSSAPEAETGRLGAAAALAAAMLDAGIAGPVLFPCGEIRREELPTRLRHEGIEVEEVVCYRSVLANEAAARAAVERAAILVVASPSVAELLASASGPGGRPRLLAVGPTTAAAARAAGWPPAAVASRPDVEALLACVRSLLAGDSATR